MTTLLAVVEELLAAGAIEVAVCFEAAVGMKKRL